MSDYYRAPGWLTRNVFNRLVAFLTRQGISVCPLYMTNMLVRHTGKRLLEKHMARSKGAAYAAYVRRTSGFIPWPPR